MNDSPDNFYNWLAYRKRNWSRTEPPDPIAPTEALPQRVRARATAGLYPSPSGAVAGSVIGFHHTAVMYSTIGNWRWHVEQMIRAGAGWLKLLTDGTATRGSGPSSCEFASYFRELGGVPIMRFYDNVDRHWTNGNDWAVDWLVAHGIECVETHNEPDLSYEWSTGKCPEDWLQRTVDNWLPIAHRIEELGGIPLFPAMATGVFQARGSGAGQWEPGFNPFLQVVASGLQRWGVGIHNYSGNHPVNEERALCYPLDPVHQAGEPCSIAEWDAHPITSWIEPTREILNERRARDKRPGCTLKQDDVCFLSVELFHDLLVDAGAGHIPIYTTEGGPGAETDGWDARYVRNDPQAHWQKLMAEEHYIRQHNAWYKGLMIWLWANLTAGGNGGWGMDQLFNPGRPGYSSDGFHPSIVKLMQRQAVGGTPVTPPTTPIEPPTEPPITPTPYPVAEPTKWELESWDPAQLVKAMPAPGEAYWHLLQAHPGADNMANTLWFAVEGTDVRGNLPDGARIMMANGDLPVVALPTKAPPDLVDCPTYAHDVRSFWVEDGRGRKSDKVMNIRSDMVGLPDHVNSGHVPRIFYLGLRTAPDVVTPPVTPPGVVTSKTVQVGGDLTIVTKDGVICDWLLNLHPT